MRIYIVWDYGGPDDPDEKNIDSIYEDKDQAEWICADNNRTAGTTIRFQVTEQQVKLATPEIE